MSFRNRLGLFFILIVIVPMVAVAVLLFSLLSDSEQSVGNANIGARQELAENLFAEQRRAARRPLSIVANDDVFGEALLADDLARAQRRAEQLLKSRGAERIVLVRDGVAVVKAGDKTAIAPDLLPLESKPGNRDLGMLGLSMVDARSFAAELQRLTGLDVVVRNGSRLLATTLPAAADAELPVDGDLTVGGTEYRSRALTAPADFPGQKVTIHTLGVPRVNADDVRAGRIFIGSILFGFLLLALACAVLVSRSLQQQLQGFLDAARRLGSGDFSAKVATVGRDEFAGLGEEFNKMSSELERRLAELRQERERVQDAVRQLGKALGSKLDRDELLKIVVQTAVKGVAADGGRAVVGRDPDALEERASTGNLNGLHAAVQTVEHEVIRTASPHETDGETNVMAHPLRPADGTGSVVGVISVGRTGRPFTQNDRELFRYLAGQAGLGLDSVEAHASAKRESMTDALTGLPNLRAFHERLDAETVRVRRLKGTALGLALIDLDNFKTINDTYGHPQGNAVLQAVARALQESSREIDLPARQHGEEFALVLPGTDLEGAFNLAERVRRRIEALRIPRLDGKGSLRITTSCGVAAVPQTPPDADALEAAADGALYEAKRSGKNKTVRAR